MAVETWEPVVGYEGKYEVSNLGRLRSLNYRMQKGVLKVLKTPPDADGYSRVNLSLRGKCTNHSVHRIVAEALLENPLKLPEVNHINENKSDNRVQNLEWCDRQYNINAGTLPSRLSVSRSVPVLAIDPVSKAIKFYFSSLSEVERSGFNRDEVSKACRGVRNTPYKGLQWLFEARVREVMPL